MSRKGWDDEVGADPETGLDAEELTTIGEKLGTGDPSQSDTSSYRRRAADVSEPGEVEHTEAEWCAAHLRAVIDDEFGTGLQTMTFGNGTMLTRDQVRQAASLLARLARERDEARERLDTWEWVMSQQRNQWGALSQAMSVEFSAEPESIPGRNVGECAVEMLRRFRAELAALRAANERITLMATHGRNDPLATLDAIVAALAPPSGAVVPRGAEEDGA